MPSQKFLTRQPGGGLVLDTAIATSVGSSSASQIVSTDSTGRLDPSLMPSGIGADTGTYTATEAIGAGRYVNIYDVSGTARIRLADHSASRPAHGFCLSAVANGGTGTVYRAGRNTGDLVAVGQRYLGTAGNSIPINAQPSSSGAILQSLGLSDGSGVTFDFDEPTLIL